MHLFEREIMSGVNDITGDSLISKVNNDKYRNNYDNIFKKNCIKEFPCALKGDTINTCKCSKEKEDNEHKREDNCSRH